MNKILVSNVPNTAKMTDSNLVDPVDIVLTHCSLHFSIWVSSVKSNLVIEYSKGGKVLSTLMIAQPTGLAINKGVLYIASQNGNIYNHTLRSATTPEVYIQVGGSLGGLAWLKNKLYVSVFDDGLVKVFSDKTLILTIVHKGLVQFGFRPLGLRALDGKIYITQSNKMSTVGSGYVTVFDPCSSTHTVLINRSNLSYPYGLVLIDDKLLVGNRGTGKVGVFDSKTGQLENNLIQTNDGLMGMMRCENLGRIYFVAANDNGLMGSLGFMLPTINT